MSKDANDVILIATRHKKHKIVNTIFKNWEKSHKMFLI